jgi:Kdo2-lipid IVA lauroyltransferase/acyltransferase
MRSALFRLLLRLFAALPLRVAHAVGGWVGWLAAAGPVRLRRHTDTNLAVCFPHMPPAERARLARRSLVETGRAAAELGALWLWRRERVLGLVRRVSGEAALKQALRRGRGAILASPHLGAWELCGLYCSAHYPLTALYRPLRMRELEALVRQSRERLGGRLVPAGPAGVRALYQALARGELVGILPDQEPGAGNGMFAPFFGIAANTMVLLSRLASRARAPVIFTYAERLPRGAGFHLHFRAGAPELVTGTLEASVQALNADVEACVRNLPAQYQWSYKRFRSRPDGEPGLYQ